MCNCIKVVAETAQKNLVEQIEKDWTVHEWIDKGSFQNKGINLSGGPTKIGMPFVIQYIRQKTNGEPEKRTTTFHITIYPTFCPFCGEKYEEKPTSIHVPLDIGKGRSL